jgi:hypothetical protein
MQLTLNPTKQPIGHVLHQFGHLRREDFPQVNQVVLFCFHNRNALHKRSKDSKKKNEMIHSSRKTRIPKSRTPRKTLLNNIQLFDIQFVNKM